MYSFIWAYTFVVYKLSGSTRTCVDYIILNEIIRKATYFLSF